MSEVQKLINVCGYLILCTPASPSVLIKPTPKKDKAHFRMVVILPLAAIIEKTMKLKRKKNAAPVQCITEGRAAMLRLRKAGCLVRCAV